METANITVNSAQKSNDMLDDEILKLSSELDLQKRHSAAQAKVVTELKATMKSKNNTNTVNGSDNCSDVLTKNVSREILERHSAGMSMELGDGRARDLLIKVSVGAGQGLQVEVSSWAVQAQQFRELELAIRRENGEF